MNRCLHCGYERKPNENARLDECPNCKMAYAKMVYSFKEHQKAKLSSVNPKPKLIYIIFIGLGILLSILSVSIYQATSRPTINNPALKGLNIILYGTTWCGYCAKARTYLEDNNIPFTEYDIEKSEKGHEDYVKMNGQGIPIIIVDGQRMNGYDEDTLAEMIKEAELRHAPHKPALP